MLSQSFKFYFLLNKYFFHIPLVSAHIINILEVRGVIAWPESLAFNYLNTEYNKTIIIIE